MTTRRLPPLALLAALLLGAAGCSGDTPDSQPTPGTAASSPLPGVTLPPGALAEQVLQPDEVPPGMLPILKGSGPRTISVVAGYSGSGAAQAAAQQRLSAHGFTGAYVAQYANPANGQVLSVLASRFSTAKGARDDFADDLKGGSGKPVVTPTIGEQSSVTQQPLKEKPPAELVIVRFRRGTTTWSLAYKAPAPVEAQLAIDLAQKLLARTAA